MAAPASKKPRTASSRSAPLTTHDWKVLGAYGVLVAAIAMYDAKLALYIVGVGAVVVVVRNADNLGRIVP